MRKTIVHAHSVLRASSTLFIPPLNNKWATFTGYPSIRITCFVLMKLVYSQQKI
nr:MAG TPA: hypothetical protein [Caudoviricetes sp.]